MAVQSGQREQISLAYYSLDVLRRVLAERPVLEMSEDAAARIAAGARFVAEKAVQDRYIYGVNTGFGSLCETRIAGDEMALLQHNHVVSHAVGVGETVDEDLCRLVLFVKLLTFRSGHTGISAGPVNRLLDFWNNDVIPAIPKKGTVGASGDLAPLAHMALPLLGLGRVWADGKILDAGPVLSEHGWEPLRLEPKEGLALTNGVQYINAIAARCLFAITELVRAADVIASLSIQAFSASETFYQALYHETAYHPERRIVAANLRRLLEGSNHHELPTANRSKQDPYSFRCLPQVHAAVRQAVAFATDIVEKECNGCSDNPLFFPEQDTILFGGNLHGESTAMALDFLAIAVSELANVSERRTYQLLSGQRGLPDFLVRKPGVNSGFMITQYTAAALVNQNKVYSTPASIDTIPTCQLQEDHVSMGGTAAYKLEEIVQNTEYVLAIELLAAAQAIDLNRDLVLSPSAAAIHEAFRKEVAFLEEDRVLATDIETARNFVARRRGEWTRGLELG